MKGLELDVLKSSAMPRQTTSHPRHIVSVFNRYRLRGGEEEVFEAELNMIRDRICSVTAIAIRTEVPGSILDKVRLGVSATWSREWHSRFVALLAKERPDVVHVHNSFPVMSPAIYYACQEAGVPVVQTLHNYRLLCPGALFYRDGKVCEDCVDGGLFHSIQHGCYRGSRPQTLAVTFMLGSHRVLNTWTEKVDAYIALTEFARRKFIQGGLPPDRITVKPNFLDPDPGLRDGPLDGAIFIGRLSEQKGLPTLMDAWRQLPTPFPLRIVGEGPLWDELHTLKIDWGLSAVSIEGRLPRADTIRAVRHSQFLIFPSVWYECFPLSLIEAFACGVPVIASRLGAMQEIIDEGRTGILFRPGDAADLAEKVSWARSHPGEMEAMSRACREEYLQKYTVERNLQELMNIYATVMDRKAAPVA